MKLSHVQVKSRRQMADAVGYVGFHMRRGDTFAQAVGKLVYEPDPSRFKHDAGIRKALVRARSASKAQAAPSP